MDTEFVELIVENFGPFTGQHRLELNVNGGTTFVRGLNNAEPALGANGAGKSKLLNAIPWCLYGRTTDDLVSTDIRPWHGKGQTRVTTKLIAWDGNEGTRHTIVRTAGPNSLTLDGKPCVAGDIEKLVGWSLPVFRQAVFLGQGQPLFHDLPNREKLDFLVDVLGLDRWDKHSERAGAKAAELDRKVARLVGEMDACVVRVEELSAQAKRQKEEADSWDSWLTGRLKEISKQVNVLAKQARLLEDLHARASIALDGAEVELQLVQADQAKAAKVQSDADVAYRTAKANQLAAQEQREAAAAELAVLVKDRRCPTCGNRITRESTFVDNKRRLESAVAQYSKAANNATVAEARKAFEKASATAAKWAAQAETLWVKVQGLAGEERLNRRNMEAAQLELKGAQRQQTELEGGRNPHRGRYLELRKACARAVADGEALGKEHREVSTAAEGARYWVKGFKDVRLFVLEDVLDELEFTTNGMLDAMGLIGWEVRYDVERETKAGTTQRGLTTTVLSPNGQEGVKWKSWSGGEGQRLRLAGALALSQVLLARAGVECNLEVLDEPTAHLSSEGVEDLCDFLADRAAALGKAVYLVDHKAIENARFARTLTVVKNKQGSKIEA